MANPIKKLTVVGCVVLKIWINKAIVGKDRGFNNAAVCGGGYCDYRSGVSSYTDKVGSIAN